MKRRFILILGSLIVVAGLCFSLWYFFGLFSPYNYFTARFDIASGKTQIISIGLPYKPELSKQLAKQYGFELNYIGCTVTQGEVNGADAYNKVVMDYLENRYGKNFWDVYNRSLDSLVVLNEYQDSIKNNSIQADYDYHQIPKDSIEYIFEGLCEGRKYEISNLYPESDTIPESDFLVLDDSLKVRGFKLKDWGRGNFMEGPRMVSLTLENNSCTCRVDKLYYSSGEVKRKYRVTERISCEQKK